LWTHKTRKVKKNPAQMKSIQKNYTLNNMQGNAFASIKTGGKSQLVSEREKCVVVSEQCLLLL
jgi:hypothetical protein